MPNCGDVPVQAGDLCDIGTIPWYWLSRPQIQPGHASKAIAARVSYEYADPAGAAGLVLQEVVQGQGPSLLVPDNDGFPPVPPDAFTGQIVAQILSGAGQLQRKIALQRRQTEIALSVSVRGQQGLAGSGLALIRALGISVASREGGN